MALITGVVLGMYLGGLGFGERPRATRRSPLVTLVRSWIVVVRLARRDDAGSADRPSVENPLRADGAAAWLGAFARVRRRRDRPDIVKTLDVGCGLWTERRPCA
eukprot:scaffold83778_cov73-Cyclotella_meneghiniana.AAC.4